MVFFSDALGFTPVGLLNKALGGGKGSGAPTRTGYDPERQKVVDERIKKLSGELDAIPGAQPITGAPIAEEAGGYKAKAITGPLPEYSAIRQRVANQANAAKDTANDALTRRYAAMGGMGSGAFVKQQQQLLSDAEDKKAEQLMGVDTQEAAERRALQSAEDNKEFQSAEALKSRALQRDVFNADQSFKIGSFNADQSFRDKVFRFDSKSKLAQLQLAAEQADRDSQDSEFSKELALYQQKHTGGLLGAGGFLGTGLGID